MRFWIWTLRLDNVLLITILEGMYISSFMWTNGDNIKVDFWNCQLFIDFATNTSKVNPRSLLAYEALISEIDQPSLLEH